MARFGQNIRISIDSALRERVRGFFETGLGCSRRGPREAVDLFDFEGGCMVGVFYVPADKALSREAYDMAPWLEFAVTDPKATAEALLSHGAERVAFVDTEHPYLRIPGGPVFRLAQA